MTARNSCESTHDGPEGDLGLGKCSNDPDGNESDPGEISSDLEVNATDHEGSDPGGSQSDSDNHRAVGSVLWPQVKNGDLIGLDHHSNVGKFLRTWEGKCTPATRAAGMRKGDSRQVPGTAAHMSIAWHHIITSTTEGELRITTYTTSQAGPSRRAVLTFLLDGQEKRQQYPMEEKWLTNALSLMKEGYIAQFLNRGTGEVHDIQLLLVWTFLDISWQEDESLWLLRRDDTKHFTYPRYGTAVEARVSLKGHSPEIMKWTWGKGEVPLVVELAAAHLACFQHGEVYSHGELGEKLGEVEILHVGSKLKTQTNEEELFERSDDAKRLFDQGDVELASCHWTYVKDSVSLYSDKRAVAMLGEKASRNLALVALKQGNAKKALCQYLSPHVYTSNSYKTLYISVKAGVIYGDFELAKLALDRATKVPKTMDESRTLPLLLSIYKRAKKKAYSSEQELYEKMIRQVGVL